MSAVTLLVNLFLNELTEWAVLSRGNIIRFSLLAGNYYSMEVLLPVFCASIAICLFCIKIVFWTSFFVSAGVFVANILHFLFSTSAFLGYSSCERTCIICLVSFCDANMHAYI